MSKDIIVTRKAKIDSFRWEIELDQIQILSREFNTKLYLVSSETSEIINDNFKQNALKIDFNGIKTHYIIRERFHFKSKIKIQYLQILINSKLLEHQYFEGINPQTIHALFQNLLEQGIIHMDYQTFLQGKITDIDFCSDYYTNTTIFKKLLDKAENIVSDRNTPTKKFGTKNNIGLQLSSRDGQKPNKQPFVKWYSKHLELENNSQLFYITYFHGYFSRELGKYLNQYKNLRRVEVTIKNRQHLINVIGEKENTLKKVLALDYQKIIENILKKHLDLQQKIIFRQAMSPQHQIIQRLIYIATLSGQTNDDILKDIGSLFTHKKDRHRAKKLVKDLMQKEQYNSQEFKQEIRNLIDQLSGRNQDTSENPFYLL